MQVALNTVYGIVTSLFLWIIGVPSPILWGVLAAAMRFVPYVGSIIAAVFPMALAIAVDPGWTTLLLTAAFFIVGEASMGYIVEPLVYGQSTGLSPFAVNLVDNLRELALGTRWFDSRHAAGTAPCCAGSTCGVVSISGCDTG